MAFLLGAFGSIRKSLENEQLTQMSSEESPAFLITNEHLLVVGRTNTHQSDKVIQLSDSRGMIAGKVFDKQTNQTAHFSDAGAQALVTNPALLCNQFWGRYVAILYDKRAEAITLVRDPLGLSTLFYSILPDGIVFASQLSLLYDMLQDKPPR